MAKKGNDPKPWERQPKESDEAFEAFCIYRDLPKRSVRETAKQLGKSDTLITRWSRNHTWTKRVAAWDEEKDRVGRTAQLAEIQKMRKRHAKLATDMLAKAAEALKHIPIEDIRPGDISRMVDIASKLERISMGDVGEVIEERDGGKAESPVHFYIPSNGRDSLSDDPLEE